MIILRDRGKNLNVLTISIKVFIHRIRGEMITQKWMILVRILQYLITCNITPVEFVLHNGWCFCKKKLSIFLVHMLPFNTISADAWMTKYVAKSSKLATIIISYKEKRPYTYEIAQFLEMTSYVATLCTLFNLSME